MVPVWKEPKENKNLLNTFEIGSTQQLPALVIFAKSEDGDVLRRFVPISEESVEDTAKSLRANMSEVSGALD